MIVLPEQTRSDETTPDYANKPSTQLIFVNSSPNAVRSSAETILLNEGKLLLRLMSSPADTDNG